jgi:hypothetical protein
MFPAFAEAHPACWQPCIRGMLCSTLLVQGKPHGSGIHDMLRKKQERYLAYNPSYCGIGRWLFPSCFCSLLALKRQGSNPCNPFGYNLPSYRETALIW